MPVTPGAAGASFDVLLAFSLDAEANRRVQQGVSTMEAELKRLQDEAAGVGPAYKKSGEEVKKTSKDVASQLRAEARALRAEANSIIDDIKASQIQTLNTISGTIGSISSKALLLGTAITGGIFAEVNQYVKTAPKATQATRDWEAAIQSLGRSRARIDQALLTTALPLLERAAEVAERVSGFVSRHPEITSIALKSGLILAGLGTIGLAVSKGIKLVADALYLSTIPTQLEAARLQSLAGDKQLAAARLQLQSAGGSVPGAGKSFLGAAAPVIGVAGFAAVNLGATAALVKEFDKIDAILINRFGVLGKTFTTGLETILLPFFPAIRSFREIQRGIQPIQDLIKNITGVGEAAEKTGQKMGRAMGEMDRFSRGVDQSKIVEAFSDWKSDDARIVREAMEERKKIIAEGEREIAQITRDYANQRVSINKRFDSNRRDIIQRFEQESTEAEARYHESRAQAIRDGAQRLQEIEEASQERLREIRERAAEDIENASRTRDALALVRAQQQLTKDETEEEHRARAEAARARRETEQRLQELDTQYAAERARRQANFEQDLRENEAQRAEALAEAAAAHAEELKQAREAQAAKLRALQEEMNAERARRREVFIAQLNDLDKYLLGDRTLRQNAYNQMLMDATAWITAYRNTLKLSTATTGTIGGGTPTRDSGGYASRGLYGLAMNGVPEFVLSGSTTRAAERAIGATLTDESLNRLFGRLGDMRSAVYNDNRRLEAPLSKDARAIYQKTAEEAIRRVVGGR